jgi:hypothetical protein
METSDIVLTIIFHGLQFGIACLMIGAANKPAPNRSEQSLF